MGIEEEELLALSHEEEDVNKAPERFRILISMYVIPNLISYRSRDTGT
jgi:hypothetical protein